MQTLQDADESQPLDVLSIDLQSALERARESAPNHWVTDLLERSYEQIGAVLADSKSTQYSVRSTRARAKTALRLWNALCDGT